MENLFYVLAVVQIIVGVYLIWQGLQWLGYVRRRLRIDPGFHAPRVAVLCPCKGIEPGLEANLVALTEFNHQNYEIFFILASASDPAASIVKRVAESSKHKAHVVIAGPPEECGEKVNNLRVAIEQLPPDFEILVFADSDGRPGKTWLQKLTAPLSDSRVGAASTMRWLIANCSNFSTTLLAAWNGSIVTMLSEHGKNFCWGGGTAIRKSVFEQMGVLDDWRTSVSDDYSLTRVLEHNRRSILFVPECLTLSYVEADFSGLLEFTNRQILITRVYRPQLWKAGAATHFVYCITVLLGLGLAVVDILAQRPAFHIFSLLILIVLLTAIRGGLRVAAATEILPGARAQIMNQAWIHVGLTVVVPYLYLANFAHSMMSRKISWRNVCYELISPNQTRIVTR